MLKQNLNLFLIFNLKKFYWIKVLILTVLAACDDCSDSIDKISIKV